MSDFPRHLEVIREQLHKLMEDRNHQGRPLSYSVVGKHIDYSAAAVSNFYNRKDVGDLEEIGKRLKNFVEHERQRETASLLKVPFVETRQAQKVFEAVGFAHRYGRIVAVIGGPGYGKTAAIKEALRRDPTHVYFQASPIMGAAGVLKELCDALGESITGTCLGLEKRIQHKLENSGRCIIIDDVHVLGFKALEELRTLYDKTGVGMVLCGIRVLKRMLEGRNELYEQLASRVSSRIWELPAIDDRDVTQLLDAVVTGRDVESVHELIKQAGLMATSARRVCNVLEIAGRLAERDGSKMQISLKHFRDAMRVAA